MSRTQALIFAPIVAFFLLLAIPMFARSCKPTDFPALVVGEFVGLKIECEGTESLTRCLRAVDLSEHPVDLVQWYELSQPVHYRVERALLLRITHGEALILEVPIKRQP